MELDYKHFSTSLIKRYSSKTGLRILSDLCYSDVKALIENITDDAFLRKMISEIDRARIQRDLSHIKLLLAKKIGRPASC